MMRMRTMMKVWLVILLAVGGVLFVACGGATPVADTPAVATEAATEETPVIDAAALLRERCVDCHDLNKVTEARYTQEEWQQIVASMIRKGAALNAQEEAALVAYLAETYKP